MKLWKSISALGVATVLLLTGCATPSNTSEVGPTAGAPGGTIRVGVNSMPPGLGNPFTGIGSQSVYTWSATFDPLVMVDKDGIPQPWLSTKWHNVDPNTWEFDLRNDVKFSNGEKFDANAVKATVDYLVGQEGATSVVGSELRMLKGAQVLSPTSVQITTKTPDAGFPARLSAMYVVAPGAWAKLGAKGFATAPIGTGPFVINSIDDNKATGTAFTGSWRPPKADAIEITKLGDSAARLQALQSGQIDLAISLSPDQVSAIKSSGATVHAQAAPQVMALAFTQTIGNGAKAINDVRVRLALNYAVDGKAIADSILGGLARPATQGSTPETFGYNPAVKGFPYDPAKAKQLLAEAGYGKGLALTATVTVGSFPGDSDIWQAVADYLSKVGVTLTFDTVTFAPWLERYQKNTWPTDMFNESWNTAPTSDAIRPAMIFSCLKTNPFVCDENVVPLINKINAEFNPDARKKLLFDLAVAFQKNPPSLLLVEQVDLNATTANTKGYFMASRFIHYESMTVK